ncbi:rhomboid family intramembrane serine protease [Lottiidibacillus patelloidae]|uniref:Rhomboid family intramembrane serine protease n=1 Tax=Lottiidibacillus patelloidae TaxID=2670334 RepID=A0A263BQC4_9BACI|nr:rhomboid family intramembrane serine protease [Lottiidibacillus patelloidae]OZM55768.1 rhomboid family intramembrane serine protease [Lottiidibacillus patelloidae]
MFVRTENFKSFIHYYPVVSLIILIQTIIFIWTAFTFLPYSSELLNNGIGTNLYIAYGEYWRLVTPIFFHGSFGHLFFNSFSLILFGPALEQILGKTRFIIGYLGAGIIANVAVYLLEALNYSHLGASGSIFGLFGIYVYMVYLRKDLIDSSNSQIVLTILVIGLVMTFISPGVSILGHIFGLIGGLLLAPPLLSKR